MLSTTRLSKVIGTVLVFGFAVEYFVPDVASYVALVPGRTLPCVWNLVTGGLLVVNPVELVIDILALLMLARLVEPVYGSKEFLKFMFLVNLMVGCTIFAVVYVAYAATTSGDLLYHQFSGFHGIIAALLVAVKQAMPLVELKVLGALKLKVKYLPSVLMLVVAAVAVGLDRRDLLAFYVAGTYSGWLYLRFFQQQPESQLFGDASDDFKFSSFFPSLLATPIDWVAGLLGFLTRLRHVHGAEGADATKLLHTGPSLLGSDPTDANRRRERGAKALEERLGLKASQGATEGSVSADVEAGPAQLSS